MTPHSKSLTQIHTAVFLFGLAGLFGKLIQLPSTIIVLGRVFFAALFLILVLLGLKQSVKLKRTKDYFYLGISGILLAIHWVTFFQSIKIATVAVGLLSYSTFPVFTTLLAPFLLKEKIHWPDILIALITFGGVALIVPAFQIDNQITQGALWGMISGLTFAI
ncbi:MAG TPA: DMT family transporter, partial [Bacillota bacterium]|nr:DMT family transporter [Bacillota bacterium]